MSYKTSPKQRIVEVPVSEDSKIMELDKLKGILNRARQQEGVNKKSRSLTKAGVWDELETLYKDLEQREKDYQIAVEIGKMLLDKNKDLDEEKEVLRQQFEQTLGQRDAQIAELLTMVTEYNDKKQKMSSEMSSLRMQVNLLQTGNADTETMAFRLSEEYAKTEEKSKRLKADIYELKQKNKEQLNELEETKTELDRLRSENEQMKTTERNLRKQLKNNQFSSSNSNLHVEESEERKKLEDDLFNLGNAYKRLESIMEEVSGENLKLREAVEIRDQEKESLTAMIEQLQRLNQSLREQEEEERRLLDEKNNTINLLQIQLEEQVISSIQNSGTPMESINLQRELSEMLLNRSPLSRNPSFGSVSSKNLFESRDSLDPEFLEKESLVQQLKASRKLKAEEHATIRDVYEFRERLVDAELKNISRAMPNVYYFDDILQISNSIIDSVVKDTRKKILEKRGDSDMIRLVSELMFENCKLRKSANEYAEAINQGTLDRLERLKKSLVDDAFDSYTSPSTTVKKEAPPKRGFGLFNFFVGWQSPATTLSTTVVD